MAQSANHSKAKGGRPVMNSGRKDNIVRFRLSEEELTLLKSMERTFGMTRTQLIKQRLFRHADRQLINATDILSMLDKIGAELGRAGNNINQLARHANTLKLRGQLTESTMIEFIIQFRNYSRIRNDTEQSLRAIIRLLRA